MSKLKILSGRIPDPYKLPGGSVGLNRALEGGLMGGRIHIFWGPKASGKTTQALFYIAKAQKMSKVCMYVDAEKTYRTGWAESCGVDVDELRYVRSNKAEDILTTIMPLIEKGEVDVVVIDSLSSIFTEGYMDKPESNGIGISSRSSNYLTSKILGAMDWETQIIVIAHGGMANSGGMGMSYQAKLSKSVEHWASTIIKFRIGMSKDNDFRDDGARQIYYVVEKSKQSVYPVSGSYWMNATGSVVFIDQASEVADLCKEEGIVQGTTWISYGDQKWQGTKKFAADLRNDPDLFEFFLEKLNEVEVIPEEDLEIDLEDDDALSESV